MTISTKLSCFVFYGFLSKFALYPPRNVFRFRFYLGFVWYFRLDVFFDLQSAHLVTNYQVAHMKSNLPWPLLSYHVNHQTIIMHRFRVRVFEKLLIKANLSSHIHCFFFDGPGHLVPMRSFSMKGTLNITSSTFLFAELVNCLYYIMTNLNKNYI